MMNELKDLLNKGRNIATTHTLFHLFDQEIIDLCYSQGYILIMDEVTDVIEPFHIKPMDLQILLENFVTIDDNQMVRWREDKMDYNVSKKVLLDKQDILTTNDDFKEVYTLDEEILRRIKVN